jgi:N-acetylglucosaminyldiphosphoundecaprenol N-acetyl-beta-D-mannosaminyltransferase
VNVARDPRFQMVRYAVGGVEICATGMDAAVELMVAAGFNHRPSTFHFSAANTIVAAVSDPRFMRILNEADFVFPDGMPLAWFGRLYGHRVERVSGPDAMLAVLARGRDRGARHFLYGGRRGVAARLAAELSRRVPGVAIVGYETPPFGPLDSAEYTATVERINATRPTHVWVGVSSPKQDFWIANHVSTLECGAVLAVGAAFDFHSGVRQRAPRWMQKSGTEWLFRLLSEPRRLGRRYTVNNARFLAIVARDLTASSRPNLSRRLPPVERPGRAEVEVEDVNQRA